MSGASTMRNAIKRIAHKERAQPAARKKLGLLEKHKDYVVRANDFKKKKSVIKTLKKKAADRNPDEFYYKMHSTRVGGDGIHRDIVDGSLDHEAIKLLKSQDMGYVVHRQCVDARKIEKLKESLHLVGAKEPKARQHTVFVDSTEELESFDVAQHFDTPAELVHRTAHNRPRTAQLEAAAASTADQTPAQARVAAAINDRAKRQTEQAYTELYQRTKRAQKLGNVADKLALQRNLMNSKGGKQRLVRRADGTVEKGPSRSSKEAAKAREDAQEMKALGGKSKKRRQVDDGLEKGDTVLFKWKRQRSK